MFLCGLINFLLYFEQSSIYHGQIDFFLCYGDADIAGNIQVMVIRLNLFHGDTAGITLLLFAKLVGVDNLVDILWQQAVLSFAFLKVLAGVDEQYVIEFLA